MESQFKRVHEGARWRLLCNGFEGIERAAIIAMQQTLQYYLPYTLTVEQRASAREHVALAGIAGAHPEIDALIRSGVLPAPSEPEGYSIALMPSPDDARFRLLVVAGADARGMLYGVHEASARLFCGGTLLDGFAGRLRHLENCPPFCVSESPAVRNRGIWTWGYPIACYRGFLDNMARLKMNMLTIWNDQLPWNIREVIGAAHERGIRIILGFHWGWGHTGSVSLARSEDRAKIRENVLETYRRDYAGLKHDGIYFQTLTEHKTLETEGRSTAAWACELVNETARALLAEFPDLQIQFGLHATSIGENYRDLETLDSRVEIVWEDCMGQVPYSYYPAQEVEVTGDFEAMLDYSKRIATFRAGTPFALVAKGWTCIRWEADFENHAAFILGERSRLQRRERLALRQNEWDRINAHWFENYPAAARFYREMLDVNPAMTVAGLVEDGLFEEAISPSVALFAETLWNPRRTDAELLQRAMRPYYFR